MVGQIYDKTLSEQQKRVAKTSDMRSQRRAMHDLLALKPGERVLDVGSGNGILVKEMLEIVCQSGEVSGIDGSDVMVAMASDIAPRGQFQQADATALPFDDEHFDAVTTSQLLCFIEDVNLALAEMFRVLKPGGRAVILDTDWGSLVWNCKNQALMDRVMAGLKSPYADDKLPRTLKRRLEETGFSDVKCTAHPIVSVEPDPDSYAEQMKGFIEPMLENSSRFSPEDAEEWRKDQTLMSEAGEYFFSLNRYLFSAKKPEP